ncbi:phosphoglucomutase/phosphomannomutase family protein [Pelolinea submarina]|uniref:Alpha-D-glucose phosphate-specific phosphoglucomutase n=1 Tax=Pelolinea submarina TaxID=913107 RepID=A0A347ZT78_9CHLR|nr:phosphoglucomutase/phosphomannomutase family protein [Pelolinea submarina]REG10916.1 alpha-D-glucose phosphate-specific phosphoglucomutase [Pelolinea submarina]BBB48509.1 phosphomannomutase [Pelolinea submarina]
MAEKIKFGTDGWRATIAEDYTFDNVRRCSQAYASYLKSLNSPNNKIVIGYDKRFLSEHFAKTAAEVLAGNGYKVFLTNAATPTPVISYSVVSTKSIGAINITASHNPPVDNGFKVRDEHGGAVAPDGLTKIESMLPKDLSQVKSLDADKAMNQGLIEDYDPTESYVEHIKNLIDLEPIKQKGYKVLIDCMWGNGAGWFPRFLDGGKTVIEEIHNQRNPIFPEMKRPEPIQPNIDVGLSETVKRGSDVLLINDGDADRFGLGDEKGVFINQLQVFGLLAYYLLEVRGERGAIVKTLSTTSMLDKLGKMYNIPVYETGVGFKYIAPKMVETDAMIGGEESGGFAFRGNVPERDGILAGLYILDMMVKLDKKPSELLELLFSKVGAHYYDRIDTRFTGDRKMREEKIIAAEPSEVAGLKVTGINSTDGFKFCLEDGGWLLIRFSGTEPLMRVYCETTHKDKIPEILESGLKIAGIK